MRWAPATQSMTPYTRYVDQPPCVWTTSISLFHCAVLSRAPPSKRVIRIQQSARRPELDLHPPLRLRLDLLLPNDQYIRHKNSAQHTSAHRQRTLETGRAAQCCAGASARRRAGLTAGMALQMATANVGSIVIMSDQSKSVNAVLGLITERGVPPWPLVVRRSDSESW